MAISCSDVTLDKYFGFRTSSFANFHVTLEQESTCLEDAGVVCSAILGLIGIADWPHVVRIVNA